MRWYIPYQMFCVSLTYERMLKEKGEMIERLEKRLEKK